VSLVAVAREWGLTSLFLSTHTQVLAKYAQFPIIPAKLVFWKRMAQCLNPELPPGVHLQTLVACQKVFDRIGVRPCTLPTMALAHSLTH